MAESEENLSNIQSEDDEITRILDGRYAKKYNKATKNALKNIFGGSTLGISKDLQIDKCSTKGWQIVLLFLWLIIITSRNISPNPTRCGSINDKNSTG